MTGYLSYIMQMMWSTKLLQENCSHAKKHNMWNFKWPSPSHSPKIVLHTFRHSTLINLGFDPLNNQCSRSKFKVATHLDMALRPEPVCSWHRHVRNSGPSHCAPHLLPPSHKVSPTCHCVRIMTPILKKPWLLLSHVWKWYAILLITYQIWIILYTSCSQITWLLTFPFYFIFYFIQIKFIVL